MYVLPALFKDLWKQVGREEESKEGEREKGDHGRIKQDSQESWRRRLKKWKTENRTRVFWGPPWVTSHLQALCYLSVGRRCRDTGKKQVPGLVLFLPWAWGWKDGDSGPPAFPSEVPHPWLELEALLHLQGGWLNHVAEGGKRLPFFPLFW